MANSEAEKPYSQSAGAWPGGDGPRGSASGTAMPVGIVSVLWFRRRVVIFAMVAVALAFAGYGLTITPLYTSSASIYIERCGPPALAEAQCVMTTSQNYLHTQAELIKSTPVLSDALARPGIAEMAVFRGVDDPLAFLKEEGLEVTVGKQDELIRVSASSPDPNEAAKLVNAVTDCYLAWHKAAGSNTSQSVLAILRQERIECGLEMFEGLGAMEAFRKENPSPTYEPAQSSVVLRQLERLSEALTEAQLQAAESKFAYDSIAARLAEQGFSEEPAERDTATDAAPEDSTVLARRRAELSTRLGDLTGRRSDSLLQITPEHPLIRALDAEIARAGREIDRIDDCLARQRAAVARRDYLAAKEKLQQIESYYKEQQRLAIEFNEQAMKYAALQAEYEQAKKLCDILDERIRAASLTAQAGALNIRIVEPARPAKVASEPRKAESFSAAIVLAVVFGCGCGLVREGMERRSLSS